MVADVLETTHYTSFGFGLAEVLKELAQASYSTCVSRLLQIMSDYFPALSFKRNPVAERLDAWAYPDLAAIVRQYSCFSNAAIHMFLEARIRNHWPELRKEIIRNMNEEMGVLLGGVPHLELMRYGYLVELGIETDGLQCTMATHDFVERMNDLFCERNNARLAGVLLAFEATAVEEFRIVESMLRRLQELRGADIALDSLTGYYIASHVAPGAADPIGDPEMDHYRGMVDAVGAHVSDEDLGSMAKGFLSVCLELNAWWEQLAVGALQQSIRTSLRGEGTEARGMYDMLRR